MILYVTYLCSYMYMYIYIHTCTCLNIYDIHITMERHENTTPELPHAHMTTLRNGAIGGLTTKYLAKLQ